MTLVRHPSHLRNFLEELSRYPLASAKLLSRPVPQLMDSQLEAILYIDLHSKDLIKTEFLSMI